MKKQSKYIIAISFTTLTVAGAAAGVVFGIPAYQTYQSYQSAEKLLQTGHLEEAKSAFWALGTYKDSTDKIKECDYQKAASYLKAKKYDEAEELWKDLGEYSDSAEQIKACEYGKAEQFMEDKEYEQALEIYENLKDYSDAAQKVKECKYQFAESYYNTCDYEKAEKYYKEADDFKDSKKRLKEIASVRKQMEKNRKKAKEAFYQYLSHREMKWGDSYYPQDSFQFNYMEMGKNKVPCLFVQSELASHAEGYVGLFQYMEGKVVNIISLDWLGDAEDIFEPHVYQKAGIVPINHSGGGYGEINTWYYQLDSKDVFREIAYTAILSEDYAFARDDFGEDIYEIGEENVSKEEFEQFKQEQLGSNTEVKKVAFHRNTVKNRKQLLRE